MGNRKQIRYPIFALAMLIYLVSSVALSASPRQVLQYGAVMGFRHYEGKQLWEQLRVGQPLALVREPENPFDNQAIRIEWQTHKLGYVSRTDNNDLARLMDNGANVEARITKLEKSRRPNNRVQFEVSVPANSPLFPHPISN